MQRGIGRDGRRRSRLPIGQFRRNGEDGILSVLHGLDTWTPSLYDLALTQLELEGRPCWNQTGSHRATFQCSELIYHRIHHLSSAFYQAPPDQLISIQEMTQSYRASSVDLCNCLQRRFSSNLDPFPCDLLFDISSSTFLSHHVFKLRYQIFVYILALIPYRRPFY